jgi:DNA-nicking Smr family endonuclease
LQEVWQVSKQPKLSTEDKDLFRRVAGEVRRLRHDRVEPGRGRRLPIPGSRIADEHQVQRDSLSDLYHPADFETGEELCYLAPGVNQGALRKLRRGQYAPGSVLDLHGMIVPVARQALLDFLAETRRDGIRCVLVVHGKGLRSSNRGPVLKRKLDAWLRQRQEVLAYCSARPSDGGTGAIYLLLRRLS